MKKKKDGETKRMALNPCQQLLIREKEGGDDDLRQLWNKYDVSSKMYLTEEETLQFLSDLSGALNLSISQQNKSRLFHRYATPKPIHEDPLFTFTEAPYEIEWILLRKNFTRMFYSATHPTITLSPSLMATIGDIDLSILSMDDGESTNTGCRIL